MSALFDVDGQTVGEVSEGRRLTMRQAARIAQGFHPLGEFLHPDAPTDAVRTDRGRAFTCSTCTHRVLVAHAAGTYPKCDVTVSHSAATDCRGWWPACRRFAPTTAGES